MKKHVFGRKFKRDANERTALFKNLLTSLVLRERIKTTREKAKAIQPSADKLITKAKLGGIRATRALEPEVNHPAVTKLINDLAPRFMQRQGGYTRIIKIGHRLADKAPMVFMEWTEQSMALIVPEGEQAKLGKKLSKKEALQAAIASAGKMKTKPESKKKMDSKKEKKTMKETKGKKEAVKTKKSTEKKAESKKKTKK